MGTSTCFQLHIVQLYKLYSTPIWERISQSVQLRTLSSSILFQFYKVQRNHICTKRMACGEQKLMAQRESPRSPSPSKGKRRPHQCTILTFHLNVEFCQISMACQSVHEPVKFNTPAEIYTSDNPHLTAVVRRKTQANQFQNALMGLEAKKCHFVVVHGTGHPEGAKTLWGNHTKKEIQNHIRSFFACGKPTKHSETVL